MTPYPLDVAFSKSVWADKYLPTLRALRDRFVREHENRVVFEVDREELKWIACPEGDYAKVPLAQRIRFSDGGCYVRLPRSNVISVRLFADGIPHILAVDLGVTIGTLVHNLRSALDVLVWELTVLNQARLGNSPPPEPIPRGNPWRQISFPVCLERNHWKAAVGHELWGVHRDHIAMLEKLQPWYTGKLSGRDPAGEWPYVLNELWNRDKHRGESFVAMNAGLVGAEGWGTPTNLDPGWDVEVLWIGPFGPVENGAKVAEFRLTQANPSIYSQQDVKMKAQFLTDIAFGKGSPAEGRQVVQTMEEMSEAIAVTLELFADEFE